MQGTLMLNTFLLWSWSKLFWDTRNEAPFADSQLAVRPVQVVCNYAYSGTYAINSVDNSVAAVHCTQDVILDFEVHTNDVNETCFSAKSDLISILGCACSNCPVSLTAVQSFTSISSLWCAMCIRRRQHSCCSAVWLKQDVQQYIAVCALCAWWHQGGYAAECSTVCIFCQNRGTQSMSFSRIRHKFGDACQSKAQSWCLVPK